MDIFGKALTMFFMHSYFDTRTSHNAASPLCRKSYALAVSIVRFCSHIQAQRKEYILSKQLLRSGTSVGANIEEATQSISRKEFIMKLSISLKEAHETRYWLYLFRDAHRVRDSELTELIIATNEIIRIISSSMLTARKRSTK